MLDGFEVGELLGRDERSQARFVDWFPLQHLNDVAVVLQPLCAQRAAGGCVNPRRVPINQTGKRILRLFVNVLAKQRHVFGGAVSVTIRTRQVS